MRDLFLVELAVKLTFAAIKASNPQYAKLIGILEVPMTYFMKRFIGFGIEKGLLKLDLTFQAYKVAGEQKEYEEIAKKLYLKTISKVYSPEEKNAIRKQYLEALRKFAVVGNGLRER